MNVYVQTTHFPTAAYCILNRFNSNLSPKLATPKLQELNVLPSPLAYVFASRLLSALHKPETQTEECWAAGPQEQRGRGGCGQGRDLARSGGPVWSPGPAWPSRGMWYLCSLSQSCCCSGPGTSRTFAQRLARSGSRAGPAAALSQGVSGSLQQHWNELCQGGGRCKLGLRPWSSPSWEPFQPPYQPPSVLTTPSPRCSAALRLGGVDGSVGVVVSGLGPAAPDDALLKTLNPSSEAVTGPQGWGVWETKDQTLFLAYPLLEGSRKDEKWMSCSCSWCN